MFTDTFSVSDTSAHFSSPFAVEKVLEERERPKVMQKDEFIVLLVQKRQAGWYHGQK